MNNYKVLSNLRHNGEVYKKGDEIELDKLTGNQLVRDGVLADKNAKEEDDEVVLAPRVKKEEKKETKTEKKGEDKKEVKKEETKKDKTDVKKEEKKEKVSDEL